MNEQLVENPTVGIEYNPSLDLVHLTWKAQPTSAVYRETFERVLESIIAHKASNYISDISKGGMVDPDDRKWLETEIIPNAIAAGLRKIATVMEENVFKQYYVGRVSSEISKGGATLKMFSNLDAAFEWIKSEE